MRIVLDTNVLVSALISDGPPAALLDFWNDNVYELVTSAEQIAEVARVVRYPKLAKRLPSDIVDRFLDRLDKAAFQVGGLPIIDESPDPDDNVILATAVAGRATVLVTGDKRHLLSLGEIRGVSIVTVRDALGRLSR